MRSFKVKVTKLDEGTFRLYYSYKDCSITEEELQQLCEEIWYKSAYTVYLDAELMKMGILTIDCNVVLKAENILSYKDVLYLVADTLHARAHNGHMSLALELPDEFNAD